MIIGSEDFLHYWGTPNFIKCFPAGCIRLPQILVKDPLILSSEKLIKKILFEVEVEIDSLSKDIHFLPVLPGSSVDKDTGKGYDFPRNIITTEYVRIPTLMEVKLYETYIGV